MKTQKLLLKRGLGICVMDIRLISKQHLKIKTLKNVFITTSKYSFFRVICNSINE